MHDGNKKLTQNWILANCKRNRNLQAPLTAKTKQPAMNLIMTTLKEVLNSVTFVLKLSLSKNPQNNVVLLTFTIFVLRN
jgi:hypothetical protein